MAKEHSRTLGWLGCLTVATLIAGTVPAMANAADEDEGWVAIFNGENLDGWKAAENEDDWTVEDGMIVGRGPRSHLFFTDEEFEDCEFKADVKLNKSGNSGMYFRAEFGPGWPKGYEAQVNNSSPDPKRTGSLYNFVDVREKLIDDDTWWNEHIICQGNHIIIKIDGKTVVDFVDKDNTFRKGHLALQQHDPGSVVHYKNLQVKKLPAKSE